MKGLIILLSFVAVAVAGKGCGKNQNYAECATACPLTCENYKNPPEICAAVCKQGCQCDEGYVLTKKGRCVKPEDCPVKKEERCGKNQHFEECGTACPLTCENRNNPPEVCVLSCNPGCQCDEGFVKGKGGKCVRAEKCPKPRCNHHEHYETCGTSCPLTCENHANEPLACDKRCNQGCFCDKGYVRNGDGQCVKPRKCPAKGIDDIQKSCVGKPDPGICEALYHLWYFDVETETCKEFAYGGCGGNGNRYRSKEECMNKCKECGNNEHYESCGTSCPLTCENYADEPLLCNKMCNQGCFCNKGYVRNSDGQCVTPQQCPAKTRDNQKSCTGEPDPGLCLALFHMWYFDVETETCKKFIYGGCGGNGNKYETEKECMDHCTA